MESANDLIKSLQNCENACNYCASECLKEDDISSLRKCIQSDLICADFCSFTVLLLSRNSNRKKQIIEICQDICAECAEECEKHDHDHCQKCAEACRQCEEHCREYLKRSS